MRCALYLELLSPLLWQVLVVSYFQYQRKDVCAEKFFNVFRTRIRVFDRVMQDCRYNHVEFTYATDSHQRFRDIDRMVDVRRRVVFSPLMLMLACRETQRLENDGGIFVDHL